MTRAETTNYSGATQIASLPYTISTPGTYYLAQDFTVSVTGAISINVLTSNVTIDLNGHTITNTYGAGNSAYCIGATNLSNITVRNGTINGYYYGFLVTSSYFDTRCTSYGHQAENVTFIKNTFCATNLQGIGCRLYHCRAILTGGTTVQSAYYNFALDGTGNTVEDCDVSGKTGTNPAYGITVASATDNFVLNNRISGVTNGVLLLTGTASYKYRDNLTSGVATPYSTGANATNAGNNN